MRYRGYYYDTATGLYYLPARYYDPGTCRFLSADPAGPSAGDPLTLNAYAYCAGDPVNLEDPSGAIMDTDGNGKTDPWDHSYHMAKHSKNAKQKAIHAAKAKISWYGSRRNGSSRTRDLQNMMAAQLDLKELEGWPPFPSAPSSGTMPIDDPKWWQLSRAGEGDVAVIGIGAVCDWIPAAGPIISGIVDITYTTAYTVPRAIGGQATPMDVIVGYAGAGWYVSTATVVVHGIGEQYEYTFGKRFFWYPEQGFGENDD